MGLACLVAVLATTCLVAPVFAGWDPDSHIPQSATITPAASKDPTTPVPAQQESGETGDAIRRRILTTLAIAALLTTCALLLLWAYVSLCDPLRRQWTEMRMREQRRHERRNRLRRQ
jgi:hypothetical protein